MKKNDEQVNMVKSDLNQVSKPISNNSNFPIVGIGASAGGLDALEQFFSNMPVDSGMAFVVIQHLDPNHEDILPEILQRTTKMVVSQVTEHLKVIPNNIYVIPPNKSMFIKNGYLNLNEPIELRGLRLPIDYFFKSLAEENNEKCAGIILSGMGSDGSLGIKTIKELNGFVLVQEPKSAKYDSMPLNAINSVLVDIVAIPIELPAKLLNIFKFSPDISIIQKTKNNSENNLEKIITLIKQHTGHDFSLYKKNTLLRRIERRMSVHQIEKIINYEIFLKENPNELDLLFKELLIGVTNFFRDSFVWDKLETKILADYLKKLPNDYIFRAWITGCSTGEEAYTFAIVFKEVCEQVKKNISLQIFATDIDADAIEIARKGFFRANIVADITQEKINKYFTKDDTGFRVRSSIREMIIFAQHNIVKDPPFTKLDFLSCRNVLIYMEPELQKKLMNLFYYSLNLGGILLLGNSENDNSKVIQFTPIDSKSKIFSRNSSPINIVSIDFPSGFSQSKKHLLEEMKPIKIKDNIQSLADQLLLQRFSPPSVIVSQEGDIMYITGKTGKYLEPAAGKANMNIYVMAREGLNHKIPDALRKARQSFEPVYIYNLKIINEKGSQYVDVTLQQIDKPETLKGNIIVVFNDVPAFREPINSKKNTGKQVAMIPMQDLEIALNRAYEDLQSLREQMQTSQEELKSANEELQSSNEELQSSNEELTTSREEMQSLNEELQTVNLELQTKVSEYVAANDDMKNLLNSTDIATLFLDKELNVRRYTEQLTKIIKLRSTDIGRPFTDLFSDLQYPEIADHSREVLKTLIFRETAIQTNDDRWFTVRIMPYRTTDDRIEGIVITFIDITVAKKLESDLNMRIALLRENNLLTE